jgi:preprotein translocase subunit SecG
MSSNLSNNSRAVGRRGFDSVLQRMMVLLLEIFDGPRTCLA